MNNVVYKLNNNKNNRSYVYVVGSEHSKRDLFIMLFDDNDALHNLLY